MSYASLFSRLLANSVESTTHSFEGTPCREWMGKRCSRGWYGHVTVRVPGRPNPVPKKAHRVMAEIILGRPLDPDTETIDHGCEFGPCISWLHFRIATRAANTSDARMRKLGRARTLAFKPLIDPDLFDIDQLMWCQPMLHTMECPF